MRSIRPILLAAVLAIFWAGFDPLQSIAEEMRESGLAHRYMGGFKPGWC